MCSNSNNIIMSGAFQISDLVPIISYAQNLSVCDGVPQSTAKSLKIFCMTEKIFRSKLMDSIQDCQMAISDVGLPVPPLVTYQPLGKVFRFPR